MPERYVAVITNPSHGEVHQTVFGVFYRSRADEIEKQWERRSSIYSEAELEIHEIKEWPGITKVVEGA